MKKIRSRPNWIVLFFMILPVIILFWLEAGEPFSRVDHVIAEIGLVVLLYGIVAVWVKANEFSLMSEEEQDKERRIQKIQAETHLVYNGGKDTSDQGRR